MATRLPPGLISIAEAQKKRDDRAYNVIGLCTDHLPPAQSRGTDLASKMTLWDPSCLDNEEVSHEGMVVRFFSKKKWQMPCVEENGDVVILRQIRTKPYRSQWIGLSNTETKWNVVSGASLLDSSDPDFKDIVLRNAYDEREPKDAQQDDPPSLAELRYAKTLLELKNPSTLRGPPKSTALDQATIIRASGGHVPPRKEKYHMLKDLVDPARHDRPQFVDLLGEVRRIFLDNVVDIKLTDYTEHLLLYDYEKQNQDGDQYGYIQNANQWSGPWGRRTITLNAWDEHGEYLRKLNDKGELHLGMFMRVYNVHLKINRNGQLEGHLRGNSNNFGTTITVHRPSEAESDSALKQLLIRKRAYDAEHKMRALGFQKDEVKTNKRPGSSDGRHAADQLTKKKDKNARKKEKKKKQKQQVEANGKVAKTVTGSNQHVRCDAIEIPLTKVSSILDGEQLERKTPAGNPYHLPFQNSKYKSKVRVLDFFPDDLADFATPHGISEYEALSDHESEDDEGITQTFVHQNPDSVRWKWHFFLMVEDPVSMSSNGAENLTPMLLQVSDQDGDYLLNMEACDLRSNPQDLAKLKEKLFVLWGDLEEKKTEHTKSGLELREAGMSISSTPFECLIKEYGVNARTQAGEVLEDEWERMFGLFKTNIG